MTTTPEPATTASLTWRQRRSSTTTRWSRTWPKCSATSTTGVGSNPAAPFNEFSHARKLADATDTFVTINNDTVYSMAQLDLSVGPLRLTCPATGDRYYVLQFVDAWTNNIAYVGTRATGNDGGTFVIVPPGWTGDRPDDATADRRSTHDPVDRRAFRLRRPRRHPQRGRPPGPRPPSPPPTRRACPRRAPRDRPRRRPTTSPFFEQASVLSRAFPGRPEPTPPTQHRFAPLGVTDETSPYVNPDPDWRRRSTPGWQPGKAKMEAARPARQGPGRQRLDRRHPRLRLQPRRPRARHHRHHRVEDGLSARHSLRPACRRRPARPVGQPRLRSRVLPSLPRHRRPTPQPAPRRTR